MNQWLSPSEVPGGAVPLPAEVPGLPEGERAEAVACGAGLTAVRCRSGALFLLGLNGYGQCGGGVESLTEFRPRRALGGLDPTPTGDPGAPAGAEPRAELALAPGARAKAAEARREAAQALPPLESDQHVVRAARGQKGPKGGRRPMPRAILCLLLLFLLLLFLFSL